MYKLYRTVFYTKYNSIGRNGGKLIKQILKHCISLFLATVMTASIIYSGEKSVIESKADSVDYNSDGEYTTKLTVEKAKFT